MARQATKVRLTWRDENYGHVSGATAFRTSVEPFPSDTMREKLGRLYRKGGYKLNANRQAWIAEYDDGAPGRLMALLEEKGIAVEHQGAVPSALRPEPSEEAAGPRP